MYVFINDFETSDEYLDLEGNDKLVFIIDETKVKMIRELSTEAGSIVKKLSDLHCYLGFCSIELFFAEVFLTTTEDVDEFIATNRNEMLFISDQGTSKCYEVKDVDLVMTMYGIEADIDISGGKLKIRENNNISIVTSVNNSDAEIFIDSIDLNFLK